MDAQDVLRFAVATLLAGARGGLATDSWDAAGRLIDQHGPIDDDASARELFLHAAEPPDRFG